MPNSEYVKEITLQNVVYIGAGALLFAAPWMMVDEFWRKIISLPIPNILFGIFVFFCGSALLYHTWVYDSVKNVQKRWFLILRRVLWSAFFVLVFDVFALMLFGRISFDSTAQAFSHAMLAAFAIFYVAGNVLDILMAK